MLCASSGILRHPGCKDVSNAGVVVFNCVGGIVDSHDPSLFSFSDKLRLAFEGVFRRCFGIWPIMEGADGSVCVALADAMEAAKSECLGDIVALPGPPFFSPAADELRWGLSAFSSCFRGCCGCVGDVAAVVGDCR